LNLNPPMKPKKKTKQPMALFTPPNKHTAPLYVGQVSEHAVIFNTHGDILLLQHNGGGNGPHDSRPTSAHYGKWHLPGGRLNLHDKPVEALQREIEEETGLRSVRIIMPCHTSRWGFDDPVKYAVTYLATVAGQPMVRLPDDEHAMAYEWFSPAETQKLTLLTETHHEIIEAATSWARRLGLIDER
jgi:8-oxo-dGTP pyrophosphatase MutT (NUDIX family)